MHLRALAPSAAFSLFLIGCTPQYAKPVAPAAETPPKPINLADRSPVLTNMSSLTYDITPGTNLGQFGAEFNSISKKCDDLQPLTYTSGTRKSDTGMYDHVFREVMASIGVPVQQAVQRFEGEEIRKADLQISATLREMSLNICFPRMWKDKQLAIGEAQLTVDWAIFSPLERKVVYSAVTKGMVARMESNLGEAGIVREAFRDALLLLAARQDFADTMSRKAGASGPKSDAIALAQPPAGKGEVRRNLERIRGAVVMVRSAAGEGSGFAIGDGSYVITAAHVVSGSSQVKMLGARDEELYGDVVRANVGRDLALIRVTKGKLKPMHVSQATVQAGQDSYAIGSPLGAKHRFSVTRGVVSGFPRIENRIYIQSDVNVLPGSSGGPLIDAEGNVIGITVGGVAFAGAPAGMNFFVPATEMFEALSLTVDDKKMTAAP